MVHLNALAVEGEKYLTQSEYEILCGLISRQQNVLSTRPHKLRIALRN